MRIDPIDMLIQSKERKQSRSIPIGSVCGARFSRRDVEGMRKTLDEMLARGESGTKTNPSIFRIARYLLTQSDEFEVQGSLTGGEAEIVAIRDGGEVFVEAAGKIGDADGINKLELGGRGEQAA